MSVSRSPRMCVVPLVALVATVTHAANAQEIQLTGPLVGGLTEETCTSERGPLADRCPIQVYPAASTRGEAEPRSASNWQAESRSRERAPREPSIPRGLDAPTPGVFAVEHTAYQRPPRLYLRGFGGDGQDTEVMFGNIPLNQASNIRAPGYVDTRLIMPEVIRSAEVWSGPYDPHQGDFAIAGSTHLRPGLERPGFVGRAQLGSFDTRRVFLGYGGPDMTDESLVAFSTDSTHGPGLSGRTSDRTSFIAHLSPRPRSQVDFRLTVMIGDVRSDFPGYVAPMGASPPNPDRTAIDQERAGRFSNVSPRGHDNTSQAHLGGECSWRVGGGRLRVGGFGSRVKMTSRQSLLGVGDDFEQVNETSTLGLNASYLHELPHLDRSTLELGTLSKIDSIDQTDTHLRANDDTRIAVPIDATVTATNLGAYLDGRVVAIQDREKEDWLILRGGPRIDSLSYQTRDRASPFPAQRTAQGFNLGNKLSAEIVLGRGLSSITSYGEGFRSPQGRVLAEGERVPFVKVRSTETGLRYAHTSRFRASLTGFASWLDEELVFDSATRSSMPAPPSSRAGVEGAVGTRWILDASTNSHKVLKTGASASYTRAVFTGTDARFAAGDAVPYVPRVVTRGDIELRSKVKRVMDDRALWWRAGIGVEGLADVAASPTEAGRNTFFVDARASIELRGIELGVIGTNLLNAPNVDAQYVYATGPGRAPTVNVASALPTTILATLDIHYPSVEGLAQPRYRHDD